MSDIFNNGQIVVTTPTGPLQLTVYGEVDSDGREVSGGVFIRLQALGIAVPPAKDKLYLSHATADVDPDNFECDARDMWDLVEDSLDFPTRAHYKGEPIPLATIAALYQQQEGKPMPAIQPVTAESIVRAAIDLARQK